MIPHKKDIAPYIIPMQPILSSGKLFFCSIRKPLKKMINPINENGTSERNKITIGKSL